VQNGTGEMGKKRKVVVLIAGLSVTSESHERMTQVHRGRSFPLHSTPRSTTKNQKTNKLPTKQNRNQSTRRRVSSSPVRNIDYQPWCVDLFVTLWSSFHRRDCHATSSLTQEIELFYLLSPFT